MSKDTIIEFKTPEAERTDPLTDLLRTGAQQLIANAVEAELLELLGQYTYKKDEQGRQVIVRNGYLPEREIQTGIG
jgi:putative transposase